MKRAVVAVALTCLPWMLASGQEKLSKHLYEDRDPYTGSRSLTLDMDAVPCAVQTPPNPNPTRVKLFVTALSNLEGPTDYALFIDLTGGRSIYPNKHRSLDTLVDGTPGELSLLNKRHKWRERNTFGRGRHIREEIPFDVNSDFLARLAGARMFQFRVNGTDGALERCAGAKELRDLHQFLSRSAAL